MADSWSIKKQVHHGEGGRNVVWKWYVYCDNEVVGSGTEDTKRDAKRAGRTFVNTIPCDTSTSPNGDDYLDGDGKIYKGEDRRIYRGEDGKIYRIGIDPPCINASIANGKLEHFEIINPWTDEFHCFTVDEISENELSWLAGLCFYDATLSKKHELVAAQLKVWHTYLGGDSVTEIQSLHNLTAENFEAIATKSWQMVTVHRTENADGTVHLDWKIEC
ncbi:MAG: hypothetical protein LBG80_11390 [Bacteroidales bacterium]|jgi:UDP-N-acetylglucosamine 2-epimerase|nr:hypothetical protein [Bacteroidales bacterium]